MYLVTYLIPWMAHQRWKETRRDEERVILCTGTAAAAAVAAAAAAAAAACASIRTRLCCCKSTPCTKYGVCADDHHQVSGSEIAVQFLPLHRCGLVFFNARCVHDEVPGSCPSFLVSVKRSVGSTQRGVRSFFFQRCR